MANIKNTMYWMILMVLALPLCTASNTCKGCTDLDELTFEKLIKRFQVTIVKFDIAYPYGDQHEAYSRFAQGTLLLRFLMNFVFTVFLLSTLPYRCLSH